MSTAKIKNSAKKIAIISFSMNRYYQGDWIDSMASRFLEELPEKNIEKNRHYEEDQINNDAESEVQKFNDNALKPLLK